MDSNRPFDYVLRGLQSLFATLVIGTDGYAIHAFRSYNEDVDSPVFGGKATLHVGVPAAWCFLMFCAVWTVLIVIFHFVAPGITTHPMISHLGIAVELVAVLSWLAGFISVAVNISTTNACSSGQNSCADLKTATAFGAVEWLLFMVTPAIMCYSYFFRSPKKEEAKSRSDV